MNTTQNSNDAVSFIYECLVDNQRTFNECEFIHSI